MQRVCQKRKAGRYLLVLGIAHYTEHVVDDLLISIRHEACFEGEWRRVACHINPAHSKPQGVALALRDRRPVHGNAIERAPGGTALVDQLLGGLFGGQDDDDDDGRRRRATDFVDRYERGAPYEGIGDDEVIQNYRAVAGRLSPQEYEEAASEAFQRMSREERREYKRMLREQGGAQFDDDDDDPRTLARSTAQYRQQSSGDDPLASLFGGGGLGGMMGGALGGGLMGGGGGSSSGGMLNNPIAKAALGGIAAVAMKRMMGGR